ncbi:hypothetical protein GCM10007383_31390 [Arenibacter certesii]|uniref:Uncharacterized protein n=1 Tax=Arenibacter certesii TaxID=228955 RepID=A0A918MQQ3_9FLAO|nr:hypothetical protein GCM10007383_31390 [Arenibacter certesii]
MHTINLNIIANFGIIIKLHYAPNYNYHLTPDKTLKGNTWQGIKKINFQVGQKYISS